MLLLYKAMHLHENGNVIVIYMLIVVLNTAHSLHVTSRIGTGLLTQLTEVKLLYPE